MALIFVDSPSLKLALDEFSKLLAALVGPHGGRCLISSTVDTLTLTSSSSRCVSNISVKSPTLHFALQSIRSQTERYGDGGLYCGILLCNIVKCVIGSSFSQSVACSILSELRCMIQCQLHNAKQLRLNITLKSIQPLIAVARSVLLTKFGTLGGKECGEVDHLHTQVTLLVRSFLECGASVGKVLLCVRKNVDKQCLLTGILYPCSDEEHEILRNNSWNSVSILLFSVMLTDKLDSSEMKMTGEEQTQRGKAQLEAAQFFVDQAVSCGVHVVACQKVVHPSLILKLKRKGILVLQRLGKRMTEALEILSGSVPISSLTESVLNSLPQLKGHLRRVRHFVNNSEDFVLLEGSSDSGICSVLLTTRSLESGEELKVGARQVLSALSQVLQDTVVCPGGGCTEIYLCCYLQEEVQSRRKDLCEKLKCSASHLDFVVKRLQEGLILAAGLNFKAGKLAVDSVYHHAWKGSDQKGSIVENLTCNCGLVPLEAVIQSEGSWALVTSNLTDGLVNIVHRDVLCPPLAHLTGSKSVLDVWSIKLNAFILALDHAVAISNIGAIILS